MKTYLVLLTLLVSCGAKITTPKYKNGVCISSATSAILQVRHVARIADDNFYTYYLKNLENPYTTTVDFTEEELLLNEFKIVPCPKNTIYN